MTTVCKERSWRLRFDIHTDIPSNCVLERWEWEIARTLEPSVFALEAHRVITRRLEERGGEAAYERFRALFSIAGVVHVYIERDHLGIECDTQEVPLEHYTPEVCEALGIRTSALRYQPVAAHFI